MMSVLIRTTWHILAWLQTYGNSIIVREREKKSQSYKEREREQSKDCGNHLSLDCEAI